MEELVARGHAAVLQGVVVGGQAVRGVLLRGRTYFYDYIASELSKNTLK